jgi:gamma-glutamyltranspeptidase/glutathione hydrolase
LLSKEYSASRRLEIDPARATFDVGPGNPYLFDRTLQPEVVARAGAAPLGGSTTHLSVVDEHRNTVALTQTLVNGFGSGVLVPGTGVVFNNAMSWFDPEPGRINSLAPGKRGLNNMAPFVVLRNGRPLLAIGAAGGRKIVHALAQIISNVIDHGMGIQDAIAAPRIDCSGTGVLASDRLSDSVVAGLEQLGHHVEIAEETFFKHPFATALAVYVDHDLGRVYGGVDPYRVATAAGY